MDAKTHKLIEKYEQDFEKISSKEGWEPKDIEMMKDLQKLMYYLEVRCAMKEGDDWDPSESSYMSRGRMGRGSGTYPVNMDRRYYNGMGSGRRYYDDGKMHVTRRLKAMMEAEDDPEMRMAMQEVLDRYDGR